MDKFDIYRDIAKRTDGDLYIGVVGPVRTGKSTFINKFMEYIVTPNISSKNKRQVAIDEMPQSGEGKTITTTEPKFVPGESVKISLKGKSQAKVRLIDCVGYLVDGVIGDKEDGKDRLVKTPWNNQPIPFEKAAEIGTEKVIKEHATMSLGESIWHCTLIDCEAENCRYNCEGECCAESIDICGEKSCNCGETCCTTFKL
jgi:stage IV sporulation protein A